MTRAQEQAVSAARRACLAWLRSTTDKRESSTAAFEAYAEYLMTIPRGEPVTECKSAYLAAWRTTLETV